MTDNILSRLIHAAMTTTDEALADLLREAARDVLHLQRELHLAGEKLRVTERAVHHAASMNVELTDLANRLEAE